MPASSSKIWMENQPSSYQQRDFTHFPDWHDLIVLDAFFNNLTSGLMICACIAWGMGGAIFGALMPLAMTVALVLLLVDLALLVADLGDPARFFHALRVMRFTSPLSVGVWGLACYGVFLGIATVFSWIMLALGDGNTIAAYIISSITRLCAIMALIASIVVICYKGVVFSCSSQPGLCQARWLTPFMVSDSLLMAMGLYSILAVAVAPYPAHVMLILPIIVLIVARCVTFGLLWLDVRKRARQSYSHERNRFIGIVVYVGGGLLPLILLFCGPLGMALAALCFFCVSFLERRWLIGLARPISMNEAAG